MSFFGGIENFFKKLFGKAPSILQKVSSTITFIAPLVNGIASLVGGPEYGPEVANIIGEVQSDLATAGAVVSQSHSAAAPGAIPAISAALTAVTSNLGALLTAGHIKDAATLAKVQPAVTMISGEIQAVLNALASQSAPAV